MSEFKKNLEEEEDEEEEEEEDFDNGLTYFLL